MKFRKFLGLLPVPRLTEVTMTGNSLRLAGKILILVKLMALTIYAKACLLRPRPRTTSLSESLVRYAGRLFQTVGPDTPKARAQQLNRQNDELIAKWQTWLSSPRRSRRLFDDDGRGRPAPPELAAFTHLRRFDDSSSITRCFYRRIALKPCRLQGWSGHQTGLDLPPAMAALSATTLRRGQRPTWEMSNALADIDERQYNQVEVP